MSEVVLFFIALFWMLFVILVIMSRRRKPRENQFSVACDACGFRMKDIPDRCPECGEIIRDRMDPHMRERIHDIMNPRSFSEKLRLHGGPVGKVVNSILIKLLLFAVIPVNVAAWFIVRKGLFSCEQMTFGEAVEFMVKYGGISAVAMILVSLFCSWMQDSDREIWRIALLIFLVFSTAYVTAWAADCFVQAEKMNNAVVAEKLVRALKDYRKTHGRYPDSLDGLDSSLEKNVERNGATHRIQYRLNDADGFYLLYSYRDDEYGYDYWYDQEFKKWVASDWYSRTGPHRR